jgi:hypothetical protein
MIDRLETWANEHSRLLTDRGLVATFSRGPETAKKSAWLDLDSPTRVGRLTLWAIGEAVLSVGDISSGQQVVEEHRQIETRLGLDDALGSLVALVTESS